MVIDGKGSLARSIWVKALSGTALAGVELLAAFAAKRRGGQHFAGAVSAPEDGV